MRITKSQFRALLSKYLEGKASAKEQQLLDKFFDEYKEDVSEDDLSLYEHRVKDDVLARIHSQLDATPSKTYSYNIILAVAASVCLLIVASYFLIFQKEQVPVKAGIAKILVQATGRGQKLTLRLADGTEVKLNGNSEIRFPENFSGNTREITLKGEAYFHVTHNAQKPFIVHTASADTKVLGTSFNVNANEDAETQITLVEGKVDVSTRQHNTLSLILSPNEQAVVAQTSGMITKHQVDVNKVIGWKDNVIYFHNTSLDKAIETLEVWYDVDIRVTNSSLRKCVISGKYQNQSLLSVMKSFQFLFGVDFTIKNKTVTLKGAGCLTN